eukprot:15552103-Heterocapsa_arctica.AAC.1
MDRGNNSRKPSPFRVVVTYADSVVLNIGFTCFSFVARVKDKAPHFGSATWGRRTDVPLAQA